MKTTFLDVMNLWGSPQAMADDLGAKVTRIQKWRARKRIPPKAWADVVKAAKRRGFDVSAETLMLAVASRSTGIRRETRVSL